MLYLPELKTQSETVKEWFDREQRNISLIQKIDKEQKEKGETLYRFLFFPIADGKAIYQIIKINKKTVNISVCTEIGDDWIIPSLGSETKISKYIAEEEIKKRDLLNSFFKK